MPDFDCRSAAKFGFLLCKWKIVHQIAEYSILPMGITIYTITVTIQYPHSYRQKSMQNRLWRWDFSLAVVHILTISAVNAQTY